MWTLWYKNPSEYFGTQAMPAVEPSLPQESGLLLEMETGHRGAQHASESVCWGVGNEAQACSLVCIPALRPFRAILRSPLRTLGKREEEHRGRLAVRDTV